MPSRRSAAILAVAVSILAGTVLAAAPPALAACVDVAGPGVDWSNCNLTGADLTGANLTGANLTNANLTNANLEDATVTGANLSGATMTGVNLTRTASGGVTAAGTAWSVPYRVLNGYILGPSVNLADAQLANADLANAQLNSADLTRANLRGANLNGADLTNAGLNDTSLTGADLTGANINNTQFIGAVVTCSDTGILGTGMSGSTGMLADNWTFVGGVLRVPLVPCPVTAPSTTPSLWVQAYARADAAETCLAGWTPSWEQWVNQGSGGFTCGRSIRAYG